MEKIDLYDKNRKPLGKTAIKYMPLAEGEYQIIVHVCLFNDKNEMLIQQRALDKIDFPGMWDISSGGGVMAGEEAYQAAERELFEELGLSVSLENERPYMTIHYPNGFDDYYLISCDKNINEFIIPQDEVVVVRGDEVVGVGKAVMTGREMEECDNGIGVKLKHRVKN